MGILAFKAALRGLRARQTATLYIAFVTSMVLSIAVSVLNTRLLGPIAFGDFKLLQTVWIVGVLLFTFGFLTTGGNLLSQMRTREAEKSLLGSLLVIVTGISFVFIVAAILLSFLLGYLYGDEIGQKARVYAVLLFVFPLQIYLQEALRGTNDILNLAILNVAPQSIYLPISFLVNYFWGFSLDSAILIYLFSMAVAVIAIVLRIKPAFSGIQAGIRDVWSRNRAIGLHVYFATIITTTTSYLGIFTLAYFQDTRAVGMFSLALTITMPLTMIPNAIATTYFKEFANARFISGTTIRVAVVSSVMTLCGFLLMIKTLVLFLYTETFIDVVLLAYICAFASVIHGMGDLYNRYLLAHGETALLSSNALRLGTIGLFGYVFPVMWYGALGASITKLAIATVYLITMLIHYNRLAGARPNAEG